MGWIWLNIPLALVFAALAIGLPLWVTFRFPEDGRSKATPRTAPVQQSSAPSGAVLTQSSREREFSSV
jgi:hypothetical protein